MVWFGDIDISWITDKDTSISKDTVEKNFVDEAPQVFELTPDLEAGTYSLVLTEKYHEKDESFEEQEDAVLSMVPRHGSEFPFESAGDEGYAFVESANVTTFPSLEMRNGEIEMRFLDADVYRSAVKCRLGSVSGADFDTDASPEESYVALPSDVNLINETANNTVTTEEGDLDFYNFTSKEIFEYDELSNIYESQQIAICRLFNSDDERIYTDKRVVDNGSYISNSLIRNTYNSSNAELEFYDSTWNPIGSTQLSFNEGYTHTNRNDEVAVTFVNENKSSVLRGFSVVEYTFDGESSFEFNPDNSFTEQTIETYYSHYEDSAGNDIIVVNPFSDGDFFDDGTVVGVQNLTTSTEYTMYVGVVPEEISVDDYARYVYNSGTRERTFVQK